MGFTQPHPHGQGITTEQPEYGYLPPAQPASAESLLPQQGSSGKGKGKRIGLTIGTLALVGALGGGAYLYLNGGGKVKPYTIALPDTLLDGQYTKAATTPAPDVSIPHGTTVAAAYGSAKQGLTVSGAYGSIADPRKAVDDYASHLDKQQQADADKISKKTADVKTETVTPLTEFHPSGFDGTVMKCRAMELISTVISNTAKVEVTTCIWGDSSAIGIVQNTVSQNDSPVGIGHSDVTTDVMSAQDLSDATVKVRNEVRKVK
ncbi:hypothetical protein ACIHFE_01245 [Streptomyces sp. NPDC052396]|uniref:hypothetical protein n=1 Tax=Streptomyces sp. NPDC052396 TaxID=3365689 RepID=UPI0037D7859C